jgi:hypothetical protein
MKNETLDIKIGRLLYQTSSIVEFAKKGYKK